MRNLLFIFLYTISATPLFAQQEKITYYKDYFLSKKTSEQKAKYKKVESNNGNQVNIKIYNLSNNCLIKEENYTNNIPSGLWLTFSSECILENKRDFSKLVYAQPTPDTLFNNTPKDSNENYQLATFGENENALLKYLISNLRYPMEAKDAGASGTVFLQFIINPDGTVKMWSIVKSANAFLDYESWELIEQMPKWNPAKKNGKAIASTFTLPIKFLLK